MKLAKIFTSDMVIQRDYPIKIWGFSADFSVSAEFAGEKVLVKPDKDGEFCLDISAKKGSSKRETLTVTCGDEKILLEGIRIGDVYLAMGQSNMSYGVGAMADKEDILKLAAEADISVLDILESFGQNGEIHRPMFPLKDLAKTYLWHTGKSEAISSSSGVGVSAICKIQQKTGVPAGLINTALGGVSIDSYLPRETVERDTAVKEFLVKTGKYISQDGEYNIYGSADYTQMSGMYNEKIAPLSRLRFAGILWYQGENSVLGYENGRYYSRALAGLVNTYRNIFGKKIPFAASQIALDFYPYGPDGCLYINEAIDIALKNIRGTYSFPCYDASMQWLIEDGALYYHPIHPVDKRLIADRFAQIMFSAAEKKSFIPPYISRVVFSAQKAKAYVYPEGTKLKSGGVTGFAIAGEDGKYVQAEAEVKGGNIVEIYSPYVSQPKYITYAFSRYNNNCNLKTREGFAVKPYRHKFENCSKKQYFQLNAWSNCDTLIAEERNFGADLGSIKPAKAWAQGLITRTQATKIKIKRGKKPCLEIKFNPSNSGYYFFGVSPEINLCGYDHHLERFSKITLKMKIDKGGGCCFWGALIRCFKSAVHRLAANVNITENWEYYTLSTEIFTEGDLSTKKADKKELAAASQLEFYFRSQKPGTLYIESVRLHD